MTPQPAPPATPPAMTHHAGRGFVGTDGVRRNLFATRWSDGSTQITFETFWDGDAAPAALTEIRVGAEPFEVLVGLLVDVQLNLPYYRVRGDK